MPLPLPNLDTRRWADLVEEGRSLIPRYAPGWTDHNIHDPGITLMELFAWLTELTIYRTNCIPQSHRRKFLSLLGFPPLPPHPAQVVLEFSFHPGVREPNQQINQLLLPAGLSIAPTSHSASRLPFRTLVPLSVLPIQIKAVQSFDGQQFTDLTQRWNEKLPMLPWGNNPGSSDDANHQPAFYLGLGSSQGNGHSEDRPQGELTLWFQFQGLGNDWVDRWLERDRILTEASQSTQARARTRLSNSAANSAASEPPVLPLHHSIRTVWEYFDGQKQRWLTLDAAAIVDETRGFTLDGSVRITLPPTIASIPIGQVSEPAYYLRCRLMSGYPDQAPVLLRVTPNSVLAQQIISSPSNSVIGRGTGLPNQQVIVPGEGAIAEGQIQVWTVTEDRTQHWQQRPDLDASQRTDAHFCLDASRKVLTFGDGERGQVVPSGAEIRAQYNLTAGTAGNLIATGLWKLTDVDDKLNQALFNLNGGDAVTQTVVTNAVRALQITACTPASGGTDEETIDHATGRAVAAFWAHEQLIDLSDRTQCTTLDQIDTALVRSTPPPQRVSTLLDFERLALEVPGTRVRRARAWAGIDPAYPGLNAPGTVTVVIVPELPQERPYPSSGLLQTVAAYLNRRRVIGTRLVVVGPQYVKVGVEAQVQTKASANPARVQIDVIDALNRFLDPLQGGSNGQGWPFGRDVYRSEILQVIDEVPGVDHVMNLRLLASQGEAQCGNLCVGPTWLVTPSQHRIEVL